MANTQPESDWLRAKFFKIKVKPDFSGCIIWNEVRGWVGALRKYYKHFGLVNDDYYGARTGQRDAKRDYKNEINLQKRKAEKVSFLYRFIANLEFSTPRKERVSLKKKTKTMKSTCQNQNDF